MASPAVADQGKAHVAQVSIETAPLVNATDDAQEEVAACDGSDHTSVPVAWALNCLGLLHTFLTAGIVFGWAALESILKDEGVFRGEEQVAMMNVTFMAGAVGVYIGNLPFGFVLDRLGARFSGSCASVMFTAGLLLCSSPHRTGFLPTGYFLLGFSGPAIQVATLQLTTLIPERRALLMSLQASAFDAGTAVFAFAKYLHFEHGVSWNLFCQCYMAVPAFTLSSALILWHDRRTVIEAPAAAPNDLTTTTFRQNLRSPQFIYLAAFASIHILRLNFFVSNINAITQEHSTRASELQDVFNTVLPFGFVVIPFGSWLLQRHTDRFFVCVNAIAIIYGALQLVLSFSGGDSVFYLEVLVAFPLVSISRQLVYSGVFHQLSTFGFVHFGKLLGTINVIVALFSCLQYPLVHWASSVGSYKWPAVVLLSMLAPILVSKAIINSKPFVCNQQSSSNSLRPIAI